MVKHPKIVCFAIVLSLIITFLGGLLIGIKNRGPQDSIYNGTNIIPVYQNYSNIITINKYRIIDQTNVIVLFSEYSNQIEELNHFRTNSFVNSYSNEGYISSLYYRTEYFKAVHSKEVLISLYYPMSIGVQYEVLNNWYLSGLLITNQIYIGISYKIQY